MRACLPARKGQQNQRKGAGKQAGKIWTGGITEPAVTHKRKTRGERTEAFGFRESVPSNWLNLGEKNGLKCTSEKGEDSLQGSRYVRQMSEKKEKLLIFTLTQKPGKIWMRMPLAEKKI